MRFPTRRAGSGLIMAYVDPLDLVLTANCAGQPIQAVANDAVDPLNADRSEGIGELIGNGFHDRVSPCGATPRRCPLYLRAGGLRQANTQPARDNENRFCGITMPRPQLNTTLSHVLSDMARCKVSA